MKPSFWSPDDFTRIYPFNILLPDKMKRFLAIFLLVSCCFLPLHARRNVQNQRLTAASFDNPLRSASDYPDGFSYVRRDQSISRAVRFGVSNAYIVSAMELPSLPEAKITKVHFIQSSDEPEGKVAILEIVDKAETGKIKAHVVYQQVVSLKRNVATDVTLSEPFTMQHGKRYAVAYEAKTTPNQEKVAGYDGLNNQVTDEYAKMITWGENSLIGENEEIEFLPLESYYGAPMIFVEMDNLNGRLDRAIYPVEIEIPEEMATQNDCEPTIRFYNFGLATVSELKVLSTINDKTQEHTIDGISLAPGAIIAHGINLGKLSIGYYDIMARVPEVDGQENLYARFECGPVRTGVIDPSLFEQRKEILIERFSTENCANCPSFDPIQDAAIAQLRAEGYEVELVVHHVGFNTDFLTLPESQEIMPFLYDKGTFAPAVALNRTLFPNLRKDMPNSIPILVGFDELIEKTHQASELRRAVRIEGILRGDKQSDGSYTYTVKITTTEGINPDDLYMTAFWVEDGIEAKKQAGADGKYIHEKTVRKFLTPALGQKIDLPAGTHDIRLENVSVPNAEHPEKCRLIVFFHRNLENSSYSDRQVFAVKGIGGAEATSSEQIASEDAPYVYVENGRICIRGAAEGLEVYTLNGERVFEDGIMLAPGTYIIRCYRNGIPYSSKVLVP